jgi:spore coat protein U-like protein
MKRTKLTLAMASVMALGLSTAVQAGTATNTFQVSITLQNACTVTVADLGFGTVSTLASAISGSTTGSVSCTGIGAYAISFDAGTGGGTLASRKMSNGTSLITYNIYADSGRTSILGDGTGSTTAISGTSTGGADSFSVYGRVDSSQNPKTLGAYSSNIVATVSF